MGPPLPVIGKYRRSTDRYKRSETPPRVDPDDKLTTFIMCALTAVLPSTNGQLVPTPFDDRPPACLASMLQRSSILDKAAELLHNDSLEDILRRSALYDALLEFIRALVNGGQIMHPVLYNSRRTNRAGHNILRVSYELPTRLVDEVQDTAPPLAEAMKNLASQSNSLLNTVKTNEKSFYAEEDQQMLIMCTNIADCAERLLANAPHRNDKVSDTTPTDKSKDAWQKDMVVLSVSDDVILQHHYFAKDARALLNVTNPPHRRQAHILKELITLKTSLPPGIFIRHGESRPDVMKIVIVGPKDTPYENGLFEFDLFCELEYPNVPPKMQLKTTGGGRVGFNPNLYPDGKVCLSLLNTWQGERWAPGKSTLLQVFVSIQVRVQLAVHHLQYSNIDGATANSTMRLILHL